MTDKQIKQLKVILQEHIDATMEFDRSLSFFQTGPVRDFFLLLRNQHENHIDVLKVALENNGYVYEIEESFLGIILKSMADLRVYFADNKAKAALKNSRSVLRSLEKKYEKTIRLNYSDGINTILVENMAQVTSEKQDVVLFLKSQF